MTLTSAAPTRLALAEFLALPETKPYAELVDGEVIPKMSPTMKHGALAMELGGRLREHLRSAGREGVVACEVRHLHPETERVYLPDLEVVLRAPTTDWPDPVPFPPDLAVEILSPADRPSRTLEKVAFYLRIGVRLVWVLDPGEQTLTACRVAGTTLHRPPAIVDAAPGLPGFTLDLADLFAPRP